MDFNTVQLKDRNLIMLDQRFLPNKVDYYTASTKEQVFYAIKEMVVRGAPLIGVVAAYGMYLSYLMGEDLEKTADYLNSSRPTAVNLSWAIKKMLKAHDEKRNLLLEAKAIHQEDIDTNRKIGEYLIDILGEKRNILTHCNAGALATTKYGTATAPFYLGREKGIHYKVYADETRPRLQGASLTAFELFHNSIDVTVITDNMAAHFMSKGKIEAVITGCDRVAANGDTANKIGTLNVSVIAKYYHIPMYIAAPTSTIDMSLSNGDLIPIEERDPIEVTSRFGINTVPIGVKVLNPAFDVTPHENITAIVTEKGIIYPPFKENLEKIFLL
ncbi:MAG: S-methyl-5-thioribose-1-phosphate isomerase [Clostridia bacterium]|nr:S-methyl-5-thioribose-1-phosphate isomerase [Clostridia bacterium]